MISAYVEELKAADKEALGEQYQEGEEEQRVFQGPSNVPQVEVTPAPDTDMEEDLSRDLEKKAELGEPTTEEKKGRKVSHHNKSLRLKEARQGGLKRPRHVGTIMTITRTLLTVILVSLSFVSDSRRVISRLRIDM